MSTLPARISCSSGSLVAAAVLLVAACGDSSSGGGQQVAAEVRAVSECTEPRCVSLSQASEALGFEVLEPRFLPDGFRLESRSLMPSQGEGQRPPGGPLNEIGSARLAQEQPSRIVITYRFRDSVNVPGIVLTESRPVPPGSELSLRLADGDCGERIEDAGDPVFYGQGFFSMEPGAQEGEFTVCIIEEIPGRQTHIALVTRGDVLIEILAFPESGLGKEDVLDVAVSIPEAD